MVENCNVDALYEALDKILRDPGLQKRMSINSRRLFEIFNDYEKVITSFKKAIMFVGKN